MPACGHRHGGIGVARQQRAVVVKHFLEMRNGPVRIGAVAGEAAAQLVECGPEPGHVHPAAEALGKMLRLLGFTL